MFPMTIKQLKEIIANLPDEAYVLIDLEDKYTDVETVITEHHSDGRTHIIFSAVEWLSNKFNKLLIYFVTFSTLYFFLFAIFIFY